MPLFWQKKNYHIHSFQRCQNQHFVILLPIFDGNIQFEKKIVVLTKHHP